MGRKKLTIREKLQRKLGRLQTDIEVIKTQLAGKCDDVDIVDETKKEE